MPYGCWEWGKATNRDGYGVLVISGRFQRAHRVAFAWFTGTELPPGKMILHSCDNPPCCNPAHLRPGTVVENAADAKTRGRLNNGSKPQRPLYDLDVQSILREFNNGRPTLELCDAWGINWTILRRILKGTFKGIPLMGIGD